MVVENFLGGSWPTIINDSSGSMGSVGYYLKTGEQGDGYYAGDGSMYPYTNNADSGSMGAGYYGSTYGSGDYHGSQGLPWGSGSMGYAYYDTQAEFGSGDYSATADYMYAGYGGEGYYSETTLFIVLNLYKLRGLLRLKLMLPIQRHLLVIVVWCMPRTITSLTVPTLLLSCTPMVLEVIAATEQMLLILSPLNLVIH